MWLTIDIGNSRTKGGLFAGSELRGVFQIPSDTNAPSEDWVRTIRAEIGRKSLSRIGIASVVPVATERAKSVLLRMTGLEPMVISPDLSLPIGLAYQTPKSLGMDRVAAASAAWVKYKGPEARPVIVVDAGTAVTYEVIDRTGLYRGGAIAPGPRLLAATLNHGTAQLPDIALHLPGGVIGRDTDEAIKSGVMWGFLDSVAGMLSRIETQLEARPFVVATGGWGSLLKQQLSEIATVDPHLVLFGIRTIMSINKR